MTAHSSGRSRQSLGEQIAADLRARIANKEWLPGSRLPSIRQLSHQYKVAPLTISRVIRHLTGDGLLHAVPSKGIYVSEPAVGEDVAGDGDLSWQLGLFKRHPPRSFAVSLPQSIPADAINLATGTMSHLAIPIESLRKAIRKTSQTYEEGPPWERSYQGELPLRAWFASEQAKIGVSGTAESRLIVSSTHQAFRIIAESIIEPGDVVLIESPSDPIVMGVFELAGARCIGVDVDAEGLNMDLAREHATRYRPKAIVTCSSGHIPTGASMSVERRRELVQLAQDLRLLVVEYDNGNEVWFDHPAPRPVKSWDPGGVVAFVQDPSRVTMAGFRVSCLTLEGPLLRRLIDSKRRDDLLTSTLGQYALLNYVTGADYQQNLKGLRAFYKERRDATLAALERTMPEGVTWYRPNIGFHVWLTLPHHVSARAVTQEAATQGVIVAPSGIFSIDGSLDNGLRITFANGSADLIEEGIARLAQVLRAHIDRDGPSPQSMRVYEVV